MVSSSISIYLDTVEMGLLDYAYAVISIVFLVFNTAQSSYCQFVMILSGKKTPPQRPTVPWHWPKPRYSTSGKELGELLS